MRFIIAAVGFWMVGFEPVDVDTSMNGFLRSEKKGQLTIPTSGWRHSDDGNGNTIEGRDDTLKFIYN